MDKEIKRIDLDVAISEVRKACIHFADLYFHFSKVLVEELGLGKAKELIERAVRNRAIERGERLKSIAIKRGLPLTLESWSKVNDIPFLGWDKSLGKFHCPYAEGWLKRYEENPWFPEIAKLYCDVNDSQVLETFTDGRMTQRITENVLCGDDTCQREYLLLKKENE